MTRQCFTTVASVSGVLVLVLAFASLPGTLCAARPVDTDGALYQREEVFEFTEKPSFQRIGKDSYEIRFASKGYCDVAVGILNTEGKTVRHLVAGVLGPNAPEPLQKNSLTQRVTWDGKNDLGRYVEAPDTCRLHVALGLKPVLHKLLLSHPNRMPWAIYGLTADKDGVYVFNTEGNPTMNTGHQPPDLTNILVYDHEGTYRRTILPLPREKVTPKKYNPSPMHGQPRKTAAKHHTPLPYAFVLPTGEAVMSPDKNGRYFQVLESNAFIVHDGVITAMVYPGPHSSHLQFFRLRTDGAMPEEGFYSKKLGERWGKGPCWIAASPDRKWLYVSGVGFRGRNWHTMNWGWGIRGRREQASHAVFRLGFDLRKGYTEPFLGVRGEPGNDNGHFSFPEGVATDEKGRIYVSDAGNNRVQVFEADGKFLKSIPVDQPYQVAIHPKTGAIYILSYPVKLRELRLVKLNNLQELKEQARQVFKAERLGTKLIPTFCLDRWASEPTIWIVDPNFHVQLWADKGDRFELKRDLYEDLKRDWKGEIIQDARGGTGFSSNFFVGNLTADPHRPYVYIGDGRGGGPMFRYQKSPRINADTGEVEIVQGATVIGWDGLGYVKQGQRIYRFDPRTGQPVAFDYGAGERGILSYTFCSSDGIGFGVSPTGKMLYHDRWPPVPGVVKTHEQFHVQGLNRMRIPNYMRQARWTGGKSNSLKGYRMRQFFPGQVYKGSAAILVYDETGEMITNDAVGGVPRVSSGVRMDVKGNIYVGVPMAKLADGKPIAGHSVVKFPPTGGRFVVNGPGVPIPLTDPPKRPADFKPLMTVNLTHDDKGPHGEIGLGDKAWGEEMLWSFGGYFPFNHTKCVCLNGRFDLDFYARSFIPQSYRNSVSVIDTNGNFILRIGEYGNQDDRGPEIRMAHCRYVAVNDKRLFINDIGNKRILSVDLTYEQEAVTDLQ